LQALGRVIGSSPKIIFPPLFLIIVETAKGTVASSTNMEPSSSLRAFENSSSALTLILIPKPLII